MTGQKGQPLARQKEGSVDLGMWSRSDWGGPCQYAQVSAPPPIWCESAGAPSSSAAATGFSPIRSVTPTPVPTSIPLSRPAKPTRSIPTVTWSSCSRRCQRKDPGGLRGPSALAAPPCHHLINPSSPSSTVAMDRLRFSRIRMKWRRYADNSAYESRYLCFDNPLWTSDMAFNTDSKYFTRCAYVVEVRGDAKPDTLAGRLET